MTCPHLAAALFTVAVLAATPAAAVVLTQGDDEVTDIAGDPAGNPAGFLLVWQRRVFHEADHSVRVRQFTPAGAAVARELVLFREIRHNEWPKFDPVVVAHGGSRLAGFWAYENDGVFGRTGDTTTGALGPVKTVMTVIGEPHVDAAAMAGGRTAVVAYRFDLSAGFHRRLAVSVLNAALQPISKPTFVSGPPAPFKNGSAKDFSVIGLKSGGAMVVYRNRGDGNVYAVPVGAAGAVAATAVRVNPTTMPTGRADAPMHYQVEAAQLADGRIVVVWLRLSGSQWNATLDVRYRLLSSRGVPVADERSVDADVVEDRIGPEVVPLPGGGFTIAWTGGGRYWTRHFAPDGTPVTAPYGFDIPVGGVVSSGTELTAAGSGQMLIYDRGFGYGQRIEAVAVPPP